MSKGRSIYVDEQTYNMLKKLADETGYNLIGLIKQLIKKYNSTYEKHNRNR